MNFILYILILIDMISPFTPLLQDKCIGQLRRPGNFRRRKMHILLQNKHFAIGVWLVCACVQICLHFLSSNQKFVMAASSRATFIVESFFTMLPRVQGRLSTWDATIMSRARMCKGEWQSHTLLCCCDEERQRNSWACSTGDVKDGTCSVCVHFWTCSHVVAQGCIDVLLSAGLRQVC